MSHLSPPTRQGKIEQPKMFEKEPSSLPLIYLNLNMERLNVVFMHVYDILKLLQ